MDNLFGEDLESLHCGGGPLKGNPKRTRQSVFEDYDGFVEKFRPKRTTDDCYTPEPVYRAVVDWVSDNILPLEGVEVVRPFWPGGDYEAHDYPEGCVVIDNPPFSILAEIRRFFHARNIRYFLFAPGLTFASSAKELDATYIICGTDITYENGAKVVTGFVTNLECGSVRIWVAGSLSKAIRAADKIAHKERSKPSVPTYEYPINVVSPAILQKIAKRGIDLRIDKVDCMAISRIDAQGKGVYGGGWLLSERAAAERAAAERAAAREIVRWELSPRELAIIAGLGKR